MANKKDEVLLSIEHLSKTFGIVKANNDISLTIKKGEIRSLSGENGSGKSTLTSIIAGLQPHDHNGETKLYLDGKEYNVHNPVEANNAGVAMVVQELGVVTNLTGAMNIFLGHMDEFKKFGIIQSRKMNKAANDIFEKWNLVKVPLNVPCAYLTMEQRKMVELARALYYDPKLLILDEITQSLSVDTRKVIYKLKDRFKEENRSMIIISHDLEETMAISDSITVLRDGTVVDTYDVKDITLDDLKQKMVGRKIDGDYYRTDKEKFNGKEKLLKISNLSLASKQIQNISLTLHKGEILGICGLSDAGIHQLGSAIFRLSDSPITGDVYDFQRDLYIETPKDMLKCKGAYLSKNRDEEGLMMATSIRNNLFLPNTNRIKKALGYTKDKDIVTLTDKIYKDFDVKAKGPEQAIGRLSGGNKQKINLGRWLDQDLDYVILDCPTRGVDIGVKAYIYQILREKRAKGVGIILITDELSEAIGMADRIAVLKDGKLKSVIERPDFSESRIIEEML